jgi:hypothetical protein
VTLNSTHSWRMVKVRSGRRSSGRMLGLPYWISLRRIIAPYVSVKSTPRAIEAVDDLACENGYQLGKSGQAS